MTIEDVILTADRRGMQSLRPYLPDDFCTRAAWALHGAPGRVLVVSGFHVEEKCETDGPPGAVAIARAVRALGGDAVLVSDGHAAKVLGALDEREVVPLADFIEAPRAAVLDFPRLDAAESRAACARLLERWAPTAVVAVERCGEQDDGTYRNMRGEDISHVTARVDALFDGGLSIGVGDGGNEIGMGSLAAHCVEHGVTEWPSCTSVLFPVIASVSNWGAYGICAALSLLAGRSLLPDEETATRDLQRVIDLDGLDGVTRQATATVDGRSADENLSILRDLHAIVNARVSA